MTGHTQGTKKATRWGIPKVKQCAAALRARGLNFRKGQASSLHNASPCGHNRRKNLHRVWMTHCASFGGHFELTGLRNEIPMSFLLGQTLRIPQVATCTGNGAVDRQSLACVAGKTGTLIVLPLSGEKKRKEKKAE